MTELPDDMDAVMWRLERDASGSRAAVLGTINVGQRDLRALLLAYQERGRALELALDPIAYALTQVNEPRSAVHGDDGKRARANLKGKNHG
jgi:hypothetical protein